MSCANSSMRTGDMMAGGCLDLNVRTLRCSACFAISAFPRASTNAVLFIFLLNSPEGPVGVMRTHQLLCNAFSVSGNPLPPTQGALRDPGLRRVTATR